MKIQMKRKRISIFLCVSLLVSFLWGCSQNAATETNSAAELKTIGEPPVAMKEVTQDSYDSTVTFRLKIPQDWSIDIWRYDKILIYPESASKESDCLQLASTDLSGMATSEKDESIFQSLFSGDSFPYEESIKKTFAQAIGMEKKLQDASSPLDYLELFAPDPNISYNETDLPDLEFAYAQYSGQNGTIMKAQYTYEDEGKHMENEYFREDFSYFIRAEKETIEGLSVDDLAVFILNSITVE